MNSRLTALSKLLKILARLLGLILIFYGLFVGVIGLGPDGYVSFGPRFIGLAVFALGIIYFIPNKKIAASIINQYLYFITTVIPSFIIVVSASYTVISNGFQDLFISGGLAVVIVTLPLSLVAPLSLLTYILANKSRDS